MNEYIITLKPQYNEEELKLYGDLIFKSQLIEGLYAIKTRYPKDYLEQLYFIKKIEENRIGNFGI